MNAKPVTPVAHGIIDYAFAAVQLLGPSLLGLNAPTRTAYAGVGVPFLGVNALTDTPVAVKRRISFKNHQRLDASALLGLGALTLAPFVRKDKKALAFHLGFLALAVTNFFLTDYDALPER